MHRLRTLLSRIAAQFSGRRLERDFDTEIDAHLAMLAEEFERGGMSPADARLAARRSFGGVEQTREERRSARGFSLLDDLRKDLKYAARTLARTPGFTGVALLTLALGIGINTALFTAFDAVALKPLPVRDATQVRRMERWFAIPSRGDLQFAFSYPEYLYLREHSQTLSSLIGVSWPTTVPGSIGMAEPEKLRGQLVTNNYFSDFGVEPILGRAFLPEEQVTPGRNPVIVLSHAFWQRRLLADSRVLGGTITLNRTAFTIVGVAPPSFIGTGEPPVTPDFWAPMVMREALDRTRGLEEAPVQILARVRGGVPVEAAQAETTAIVTHLEEGSAIHNKNRNKTASITLPRATYFGNTDDIRFQTLVGVLMLVVGMVLAIACANLANMLLARSASRQREIAVRLAMGASRARLLRQLLTESILLALAGGVAGLAFSVWTGKLIWAVVQHTMLDPLGQSPDLVISLTPDAPVLGYTLLISLITGIAFGLAPALRSSRVDLTTALKEEGTMFGAHGSRSRLRSVLVAGQVAVSMLLLAASGLLVRGLTRSGTVSPGFDTGSIYWLIFPWPQDQARAAALEHRLRDRLVDLPEVRSVSILDRVPYTGTWTPPVEAVGSNVTGLRALGNYVDAHYFETLGIPVDRGRVFTAAETAGAGASVAIVSDSTAHELWPNQDPIGKRLRLDLTFRNGWKEFEVVGVARSVASAHLSRVDPLYVYLPQLDSHPNNMVMRIQGDRGRALARVRATFEEIDRDLMPGLSIVSLEQGPMRLERVMGESLTISAVALAVLALALASVGIYGVMSYLVSQRTREIGVMMALGADARTVIASVIRQGLTPVVCGLLIGLAAGVGLSILVHASLSFPGAGDPFYGLSTFDPVTFVGLPALVGAIALLASLLPVRRALKVDPMVALRHG